MTRHPRGLLRDPRRGIGALGAADHRGGDAGGDGLAVTGRLSGPDGEIGYRLGFEASAEQPAPLHRSVEDAARG